MNDLICIGSIVIVGTSRLDCSQVAWSNIKLVNYLRPIIDRNHLVKRCKTRSHVKHGLLWLDCDSQIRTKLANLWGIFDRILKNGLFDAQSFWFKKESFWFQKSRPWCAPLVGFSIAPFELPHFVYTFGLCGFSASPQREPCFLFLLLK